MAGFLAVWLAGWTMGESFALVALARGAADLLRDGVPFGRDFSAVLPTLGVGAFLFVWLVLWTVGGLAAARELLRMLASEDRLSVSEGSLVLDRRLGPFRSHREFPRESVLRVALARHREALSVWTAAGCRELSVLGTRAEREEAARSLRRALGLADASEVLAAALPEGWEEVRTEEGERAIVASPGSRRRAARVASVLAVLCGGLALWRGLGPAPTPAEEPFVGAFGIVAGLAAWAAFWLGFTHVEWIVASGQIRRRRRLPGSADRGFEGRALEIRMERDSDGDEHYTLDLLAPRLAGDAGGGKRARQTIHSAFHDPTAVRQLGAWLARAAQIPLDDRAAPAHAEAEKDRAVLRAQLEAAGRLGRWASRAIDWSESRRSGS